MFVYEAKTGGYYFAVQCGGELRMHKILRYLSSMHSFSEYEPEYIVTDPSLLEDNSTKSDLAVYFLVGRVVPLKDSEIKLIV